MVDCLSASVVVVSLCGVALSYYAVHIAAALSADQDFKPSCDLDESISCSHALLSDYSKGFGIIGKILGEDHILNLPNSYMGLIFFPVMLILALSSSKLFLYLALLLSFVSTVTSAYLIYILVYILQTICLVCLPVHLVNIVIFILFTLKWRTMNTSQTLSKERKKKEN